MVNERKLKRLKSILESAHEEFMETNEIFYDALEPALRYVDPVDKEFAAFICSIIAYGRISQVKRNIHSILDPMGDKPVKYLISSTDKDLKKLTSNWKHRFNTSRDMFIMLSILKKIYRDCKSLEKFVEAHAHSNAYDLQLSFYRKLELELKKFKNINRSFYFFIPDPSLKSALKRMNLFLKWMVRDTEPDLGLWKSFSKASLIVPLDTHIHKQALSLGFTRRTAADLQTAIEITEKLKLLDASDPTKYDFALCHLSIRGKILSF